MLRFYYVLAYSVYDRDHMSRTKRKFVENERKTKIIQIGFAVASLLVERTQSTIIIQFNYGIWIGHIDVYMSFRLYLVVVFCIC